MKSSNFQAFVSPFVLLSVAMISIGGAAGVGTVWLRHQISVSAAATKTFQLDLRDIERRIAENAVELAAEQTTDELEHKNQYFALGLERPRDLQIVRVDQSPKERLEAKRDEDVATTRTQVRQAAVRFRIAEGRTR